MYLHRGSEIFKCLFRLKIVMIKKAENNNNCSVLWRHVWKKLSVKLKWKLSRETLILVDHLRTESRIKLHIFQLNKGNKQTDSWTKTFRLYRSTCIKWINFFLSCGEFLFWISHLHSTSHRHTAGAAQQRAGSSAAAQSNKLSLCRRRFEFCLVSFIVATIDLAEEPTENPQNKYSL